MINPEELATTSLILLEEAVLAILYIEQSELKPEKISNRIGIEKNYSYPGRAYPIVASLLHKLEREDRVERDRDTPFPKWRLTESENRERH